MTPKAALLYDRDCGFCRWSVARILHRDTQHFLLPIAIQSAEGHQLLTGIPERRRLASWHLVRPDGTVVSGGAVAQEVADLLGMRWRARWMAAVPGIVNFGYWLIAGRRVLLGHLFVTAGARKRADELLAWRAPPPFASGPGGRPAGLGAALASRPTVEPTLELSLQERVEGSDFGRGLITAFLVATLIAIVAMNLPNSTLRQHLMRPAQPYLNALGLDQSWALFAPDPRRAVIDFDAVVSYDDGTTAVWRFPHNDPLIGAYRDYRWRKWAENVINNAYSAALWRPAALWAAGRMSRSGRRVTTVRLVRRSANLNPPGASPSQEPWHSETFYTLHLTQ